MLVIAVLFAIVAALWVSHADAIVLNWITTYWDKVWHLIHGWVT